MSSAMYLAEGANTSAGLAAVIVLVVLLVGVSVIVGIVAHRRRMVFTASSALERLGALNAMWFEAVKWQPSLNVDYRARVNSKAKFDRFDLSAFMAEKLLETEPWFAQEIQQRIGATHQFSAYDSQAEGIAAALLGTTRHPRVSEKTFVRVEARAYSKRRFSYPVPSAHVTATVSYTSPQGRNSYASKLTWDFAQLCRAFDDARARRDRMTTAEALRKRERSRMTQSLRIDVLRRDAYRCQMCGATPRDGETLHVDHIDPVSHGGLTVLENLRTLCASCNLGKGNRFVG